MLKRNGRLMVSIDERLGGVLVDQPSEEVLLWRKVWGTTYDGLENSTIHNRYLQTLNPLFSLCLDLCLRVCWSNLCIGNPFLSGSQPLAW